MLSPYGHQPRIHFHDLRHTAATLLLSQNVPVKVVSEMLVHSDVATTLRVYSHVLPDMQRQALDAWDGLFTATARQGGIVRCVIGPYMRRRWDGGTVAMGAASRCLSREMVSKLTLVAK